MKKNIVLIGFMGVGKGSVSRELSKELNKFCIDSDDLIESLENRKIKDIFAKDGENYFRSLESKCGDWIINCVDNTIISTGGGFPVFFQDIKKMGKIFYLESTFDGIYNRILNSSNPEKKLKKRPLFQDPKKAKELLENRLEIYKKSADVIIQTENKTTNEIVKEIIKNKI